MPGLSLLGNFVSVIGMASIKLYAQALTIAIFIVMGLGVKECNIIHSGEVTDEVRPCQHIDDILALACGLVVCHAINKHIMNAFYIQGHSTSSDSGSSVSFLLAAAAFCFSELYIPWLLFIQLLG